jgi:hypothetical protein
MVLAMALAETVHTVGMAVEQALYYAQDSF